MNHTLCAPVQAVSFRSAMLFSFTGLSSAATTLFTESEFVSVLLGLSVIAATLSLIVYDPAPVTEK
mgnify:CR=1 FL=1